MLSFSTTEIFLSTCVMKPKVQRKTVERQVIKLNCTKEKL